MNFLINDLINLLGFTGASIVLLAFLMNQAGKIKHTDPKYDVANFVGSSLLFIYAAANNSLPFIIVNLAWAGSSLKDIYYYYFVKKQ